MSKRFCVNGIYRLETSDVWGTRVLDIKSAEFFVERVPGDYENTSSILGRREECIPVGPRHYAFDSPLLEKFGVGSGFSPDTPCLRAEFFVPNFKDERPLRDLLWGGSAFRMGAWIITARFKSLLEAIDPGGWEYWPVSTSFRAKSEARPGPDVWLCELIRGLQAVDDPGVLDPSHLMQRQALRFRAGDIGQAPFFRDPLVIWKVLCRD
jgi:hypothetical protein